MLCPIFHRHRPMQTILWCSIPSVPRIRVKKLFARVIVIIMTTNVPLTAYSTVNIAPSLSRQLISTYHKYFTQLDATQEEFTHHHCSGG